MAIEFRQKEPVRKFTFPVKSAPPEKKIAEKISHEKKEEVKAPVKRSGGRSLYKTDTKSRITIWLDNEVIDHFRTGGSGWQTRLSDYLRDSLGLGSGLDDDSGSP